MKDNLKIAIVGMGGIGSYFTRGLSELIKKDISGLDRVNVLGIDLFDMDIVEEKNLSYTTYDIEHLGLNKVDIMSNLTGYKAIHDKIENPGQLSGYDMIVLCVDNNTTRLIAYESGKPLLDLRANGKSIFAYLTSKELDIDNKYINLTTENNRKGGCQREEDLLEKNIQLGNSVVANIGLQFLLDYLREETKQKELILYI